ncbi:MAG: PBSX family phage terminase large subunit [Candidatus Gastranaerophilales bacterium]|nr:PBSX family phage terminase large subunit [Candidatus Gastranaerophilales bacterium]
MTLIVPQMLNLPPKMMPMITEFNNYTYFLGEGGRGSSKTQSVARFLLFLADKIKLKICCGREIQNTINESVKAVFETLIDEFNLNFTIRDKEIVSNSTGTTISFKGFREQGKVNIKGLADIDILWIDEAEAISKPTLDVIVPTIVRKKNAKIFFTMNRFVRNDAVYKFCAGRDDCLHITINYFDNPFLTEQMFKEAEICKHKNLKDYNHIWLGHPLDQANDFLVSASQLDRAKSLVFNQETHITRKVMAVDLSASGGDLCVAKLFTQKSITGWEETETVTWSEPDTDITKGKIIELYSRWEKPDILTIDADGLGYPIWNSVKKSIPHAIGFRGAGSHKNPNAGNARADGYLAIKDFLENGWLKLTCDNAIRQLEYIKKVYKPSGIIFIQDKKDIRKEQSESPDFADTVMMAIYSIVYHSHLFADQQAQPQMKVDTDFDPFAD